MIHFMTSLCCYKTQNVFYHSRMIDFEYELRSISKNFCTLKKQKFAWTFVIMFFHALKSMTQKIYFKVCIEILLLTENVKNRMKERLKNVMK